ncbi:MAG: tRNA lysidine(34) synthetase TilS [Ignavibacteriales bacterium]|nr:tRNA lysidine(34) synthetase TilS [Ignavibacteriales bacterium]
MKKHQKTIEQDVINFINRHQLLNGAKKILIGLSGGGDSVFALYFLNKFKQKYQIEISAVHVNHNLRGAEAKRDEDFCRKLCLNWQINFFCESANVKQFAKKKKLSIEEAARIIRYEKFDEVLKKNNSDFIVTAHNIDDNLESVLLNFVSGTGIEGLSGISVKRENIIRPFLCISKSEILEYLKNKNIDFVIDSTNFDSSYRRNYIRNEISPMLKKINPSLNETVLNSSEVLRNQNISLNFFIEKVYSEIFSRHKNEFIIELTKLEKYPKEIFGEILKLIFEKELKLEFNFNDFLQFEKLIGAQTGKKLEFNKKFTALKENGKILIKRKIKSKYDLIYLKLDSKTKVNGKSLIIEKIDYIPNISEKSKYEEIISGDYIKDELILRKWQIGDKIKLLGMKGTKKISDVLTDLKIPGSEKEKTMVLINNNEVVCLLGHRISENYKITEKTKCAIKICLK